MRPRHWLSGVPRTSGTVLILFLFALAASGVPGTIAQAVPTSAGPAGPRVDNSIGLPRDVANRRAAEWVSTAYAKLPLSFEANWGQADSRVKFLSRSGGHTLFLAADEAVLVLDARAP